MKTALLLLLPFLVATGLVSCRKVVENPGDVAGKEAASPAETSDGIPDIDFVRFAEESPESGRLETAIVSLVNEDGVRADLIAAVHVADPDYYAMLQVLFSSYEALLYEMIAPSDVRPSRNEADGSVISNFQRNLCRTLALDFQLHGIDYHRDNFVHADLTPDDFVRLMDERGETIWSIALETMIASMSALDSGLAETMSGPAMLDAYRSKNSAVKLKMLFARAMEQGETLLGEQRPGPGDEAGADRGSMLIHERNKAAVAVLVREVAAGKKNLALFYGAAHMPDMERRLRALGFERKWKKWLTAWDVR